MRIELRHPTDDLGVTELWDLDSANLPGRPIGQVVESGDTYIARRASGFQTYHETFTDAQRVIVSAAQWTPRQPGAGHSADAALAAILGGIK